MKIRYLIAIILSFLLIACEQNIESPINTTVNNEHQTNDLEENVNDVDTNHQEGIKEPTDENESESQSDLLNELKVHYIDVGQADATLFQFTYDHKPFTILYDAGDWNKNDVVDYLTNQNITFIDLIIISHPHADHTGQLAKVVNTFGVGEVWLSGNTSTSQTFQDGLEAVLATDADYYEPRAGDEFEIGPLKIDVLHPSNISGKLNEESISLLFTYGDMKFVFTGDAGKKEEIEMIDRGIDMKADILSLGHHGSDTSTDQAFIHAVDPEIAIYSAGTGNSYGHPHPEVVSRVQDAGITLYGTDVHGTILVTTDGSEYTITTKENGTMSPESTESTDRKENVDEKKQPEKDTAGTNHCLDINQASLEEVQQIIHIGPERAQSLMKLRPFDSVDDLDQIKGIGPASIVDIKDEGLACVQ